MKNSENRKAVFILALCMVFFLPVQICSSAEQASIDVYFGFNNYISPGSFVPVRIHLRTVSPVIKGTLSVQTETGSAYEDTLYQTVYTREIDAASETGRDVYFTLKAWNFSAPVSVKWDDGGGKPVIKKVNFEKMKTGEPLILCLSRSPVCDFLAREQDCALAYISPQDLPVNPEALEGTGLLIIHDIPLDIIMPAQAESLKQWVSRGGGILFTGTPSLLQQVFGRLAPLFPGEIRGASQAKSLPLFFRKYGIPATGGVSFPLWQVIPGEESDVLSENGRILFVKRPFGAGFTAFAAFDFAQRPFSDGSMAGFFKDAIIKGRDPPLSIPSVDTPLPGYMEKKLVSAFPAFQYLPLFGAGFFIILLLLIFVPKKEKSFTYRLVILAAVPLTVAGFFWMLLRFQLVPSSALLQSVEVIEVIPGSRTARIEQETGLYSFQDTVAGLSHDSNHGQGIIFPLTPYYIPEEPFIVRDGGIIEGLNIAKGKPVFIKSTSIIDFPLIVQVQGTAGRVELKIENQTNRKAEDIMLINNNRCLSLGSVDAGDKLEKSIELPLTDALPDTGGLVLLYIKRLLASGSVGPDDSLLTGMIESPVNPVKPDKIFFFKEKLTFFNAFIGGGKNIREEPQQ
ncbi:MAG: hypothetical protein JW969_09215 [Spirochaetales bacterium]|nr:hypothetical protein [Spirochaetales bacterium]